MPDFAWDATCIVLIAAVGGTVAWLLGWNVPSAAGCSALGAAMPTMRRLIFP